MAGPDQTGHGITKQVPGQRVGPEVQQRRQAWEQLLQSSGSETGVGFLRKWEKFHVVGFQDGFGAPGRSEAREGVLWTSEVARGLERGAWGVDSGHKVRHAD